MSISYVESSSCVHVSRDEFHTSKTRRTHHVARHTLAHTSTIKLPRNLSVHLIKAAQSLERHLAAREATAAGAVVGKLIILDDRRRQKRLHR